jgi:hypothetical protein
MTIRKPICFVAMAFGNDDTDQYYENLVLPVLKQNNITPVIINRHQSNDDLNFQIFEQLRKADLCIADLTYTRPSVYFEAGFAEREIPVIYTVRKDHLSRSQPDDRRVHFDLQMKPLIDWKTPNDKTFSRRLELRIKSTFLSAWLRDQTIKQKDEEAEKRFNSVAPLSRLAHLRSHCVLKLHEKGYDKKNWYKNYQFDNRQVAEEYKNEHKKYVHERVVSGYENYVHGYKVDKNKLLTTSVQAFTSPTKTELINIAQYYTTSYFLSEDIKQIIDEKKIKNIYINVLVVSLNTLSSSRIENALPNITPLENSNCYYINVEHGIHRTDHYRTYTKFYFLSGIKSTEHFKEELNSKVLTNL